MEHWYILVIKMYKKSLKNFVWVDPDNDTKFFNWFKLSSNGLLFIFEAYPRAKQQVIQSQGDLCKKMKTAANQGGKK